MASKKETAVNPAAETNEVKLDFFTRYSKIIYGVLIAIVVIIIAVFLFIRHAKQQREEAAERYAVAVAHLNDALPHFLDNNYQYPVQFRSFSGLDSLSLDLALNGDGADEMGLLAIAEEYGSRAPETINLHIAACYLYLGEYAQAADYAAKYSTEDPLLNSRAFYVKGNALMQLEDYEGAKSAFLSAASRVDEDLAAGYLFNAALACEKLGQYEEAVGLYTKIRDRYASYVDQRDPTAGAADFNYFTIEAEIARVETLLAK